MGGVCYPRNRRNSCRIGRLPSVAIVLSQRAGLMSGAREVHLTPKALALLSFIAERPGDVITKEELFAAVWPEVAVGDAALVTCIQELRKALRDDARRPRYIETLHRRGYRFIAKAASSARPLPVAGEKALPLPDRPSIAVLPFANMSDDPDQDHFADGISEDLITGLSHIRWLFVIARNSSFVYKNRAVDVKDVSRALGVRYVLEGSVRRAGNRLRITAQLVDAIERRPSLGRTLRPRDRRHLRHAGRDHPQRRGERSSLTCWPRRAFAPCRARRTISEPGNSSLARKTHFGRLTRADYERGNRALSNRPCEIYPDYAPARSLLGFCLVFASHMGWSDRDSRVAPQATSMPPAQLRSMIAIPGDTARSATAP